jgi:upstream activation factor subunit UAF30
MATAKKPAAAKQEAEATKKAPAKKAAPVAAPEAVAAPAKKTSKKAAAPAVDVAAAAPAKRAPNAAFMKALRPTDELAAIVGSAPLPRTEVTKKVWEYIKKHDLQDAKQRTMINADAKLKKVLGKPQVTMFEMTKLINVHLLK